MTTSTSSPDQKESCYSWYVLAAAAISNLLGIGFLFGSVGVLTAEYNKVFDVDVRASSWVGSVLTGVLLCSGKRDDTSIIISL